MSKISEAAPDSNKPQLDEVRAARIAVEAAIRAAELSPDDEECLRRLLAHGGFDPTLETGF